MVQDFGARLHEGRLEGCEDVKGFQEGELIVGDELQDGLGSGVGASKTEYVEEELPGSGMIVFLGLRFFEKWRMRTFVLHLALYYPRIGYTRV